MITMTENYITEESNQKHHEFRIPTREEFHRYAMHPLCQSDFETSYCTPNNAERIVRSLKWTEKMMKILNHKMSNKKKENFMKWYMEENNIVTKEN